MFFFVFFFSLHFSSDNEEQFLIEKGFESQIDGPKARQENLQWK